MHKPDENQQRCLTTWLDDTRPLTEHMTHMTLGLSSEVGEFVGLVDKQLFKPSKQVTRRMMLDELGDVLYYVTIAAHLLGVTVDELYRLNAEKLAGGHGWVAPTALYNWGNAPEGATWAATDEDGTAYWFPDKPYIYDSKWLEQKFGQFYLIEDDGNILRRVDWRDSLEARPE